MAFSSGTSGANVLSDINLWILSNFWAPHLCLSAALTKSRELLSCFSGLLKEKNLIGYVCMLGPSENIQSKETFPSKWFSPVWELGQWHSHRPSASHVSREFCSFTKLPEPLTIHLFHYHAGARWDAMGRTLSHSFSHSFWIPGSWGVTGIVCHLSILSCKGGWESEFLWLLPLRDTYHGRNCPNIGKYSKMLLS